MAFVTGVITTPKGDLVLDVFRHGLLRRTISRFRLWADSTGRTEWSAASHSRCPSATSRIAPSKMLPSEQARAICDVTLAGPGPEEEGYMMSAPARWELWKAIHAHYRSAPPGPGAVWACPPPCAASCAFAIVPFPSNFRHGGLGEHETKEAKLAEHQDGVATKSSAVLARGAAEPAGLRHRQGRRTERLRPTGRRSSNIRGARRATARPGR
jgi:hypothetical protein